MNNQCPHPKSLEKNKKPNPLHTHTHKTLLNYLDDAWQYSSFNVQPIFLRQFLISGWELTNLGLLKKSNFVFMYLEFFKRFNLVLKTQLENENKRIKNCIIEEVTCIGFFFIPNVDQHRTNKQSDPELVYDDFPRKYYGSHTIQLRSQLPCPQPAPRWKKEEGGRGNQGAQKTATVSTTCSSRCRECGWEQIL